MPPKISVPIHLKGALIVRPVLAQRPSPALQTFKRYTARISSENAGPPAAIHGLNGDHGTDMEFGLPGLEALACSRFPVMRRGQE